MEFHPGARPEFVRTVQERLARLRDELPSVLPAGANPVVLEIGSGHGHFLTRYAAAHPGVFCLGIDLLGDRLEKATRKREVAGLANVHFHKAEASEFLECAPGPLRFSAVFALFPDPWPKKRHHKNRLIQPSFLSALALRMAPGGRLHFRTDDAAYFADARDTVAAHPDWLLVPAAPWPFEEVTVFQKRAPAFQSLIAEAGQGTPQPAD